MRCHECGGIYEVTQAEFQIESKIVGTIIVPDISLEECKECGDQLLPPKAVKTISEYIKKMEADVIGKLPISNPFQNR